MFYLFFLCPRYTRMRNTCCHHGTDHLRTVSPGRGASTFKRSPFKSIMSPSTTVVSTSATWGASTRTSFPLRTSWRTSRWRWKRKVWLASFHFLHSYCLIKRLVSMSAQLSVQWLWWHQSPKQGYYRAAHTVQFRALSAKCFTGSGMPPVRLPEIGRQSSKEHTSAPIWHLKIKDAFCNWHSLMHNRVVLFQLFKDGKVFTAPKGNV